jgi:hypothetical protein
MTQMPGSSSTPPPGAQPATGPSGQTPGAAPAAGVPQAQPSAAASSQPSPAGPAAGPVGTGDYEVQPGQSVDSIAYDHGLFWQTIWNDPNNQQLRQARKNPNILLPGDRVFIPQKREKQEPGATEKRHRFKRKGVPAGLNVVMKDSQGKPRAGLAYTLVIEGVMTSGKTDAAGRIQCPIPPNATSGRLVLGDQGQETYTLKLGDIDPIEALSGVQQRLSNLGFYRGSADGRMTPATEQAVKDFQAKSGLPVTGSLDQATRDKLRTDYGC